MSNPNASLNVRADLFARVAACASGEEARYYHGVHVEVCESGGVTMVATDGHILIAINDPSGEIIGGPATVSATRATLAECRKTASDRRPLVVRRRRILAHHGRLAIVEEPKDAKVKVEYEVCDNPGREVLAFQWTRAIIDGKFPDWRRVLPPKFDPAIKRTGMNSIYVERLSKSLRVDGCAPGIVTCGGDDNDQNPAWLFCPASQNQIDGFGVIMPLRVETPKLPKWLNFQTTNPAKEAA